MSEIKETGSGFSETKETQEVSDQSNERVTESEISDDKYNDLVGNKTEDIESSSLESVEDNDPEESLDTGNPHLPKSHGEWEGERGDSKWIPEDDYIPQQQNPEKETWADIKDEYGFDGIEFNDNSPDFSDFSRGEVKIDDFSDSRYRNFNQADVAEAKKRGCDPDDVAKWREENKYTWHELSDCETMQKVPSKIHNNIPHSGGISEIKNENKRDLMEEF